MSVLGELLFWRPDGADLDGALRHQGEAGLQGLVDALSEGDLRTETDDALIQRVSAKASISPLRVLFDQGEPDVREIMIETENVFREGIRVKGLRATTSFPFSGDTELWHLRTNPYDMNPPRGIVNRRAVTVGMEVRDHEGNQAAAHIEDSVRRIKECLQRQEVQIAAFNVRLPSLALPMIHRRRQALDKASELLKKLQG